MDESSTETKRKLSTSSEEDSPPRKQYAVLKPNVGDNSTFPQHCETNKSDADSNQNNPANNREESLSTEKNHDPIKSLTSNAAPSTMKITTALESLQTYDSDSCSSMASSSMESKETDNTSASVFGSIASGASISLVSKEESNTHITAIENNSIPVSSKECGDTLIKMRNTDSVEKFSATSDSKIESLPDKAASEAASADNSYTTATRPNTTYTYTSDSHASLGLISIASKRDETSTKTTTTPFNSGSLASVASIATKENDTAEHSNSGSIASMPSMESGTTVTAATTATVASVSQTSVLQLDISTARNESETSITIATTPSTSIDALDNSTDITTTTTATSQLQNDNKRPSVSNSVTPSDVLPPSTSQNNTNTSILQPLKESFKSKTCKSIKCIEERQQFLTNAINAMFEIEDCCVIPAIKCIPPSMTTDETIKRSSEAASNAGFYTNLNSLCAYIRRAKSFNGSTEDLKAEEFIKTLISEDEYAAFKYKKKFVSRAKLDYVNIESFGKDECAPKSTSNACTQTNDSSKKLLHKMATLKERLKVKAEEIESLKATLKQLTPNDEVEEK